MSNKSWVTKLNLEVQEDNEDGSVNIVIDWDENDPDLQMWTEWGEEKQKDFILTALRNACHEVLDHDA